MNGNYNMIKILCILFTILLVFWEYETHNPFSMFLVSAFVSYGVIALVKDLKEVFYG